MSSALVLLTPTFLLSNLCWAFGCREPHCDLEAGGTMGVGPVRALPSTCVQKAEEQPEDADNQRNVTRMGSQPSEPSAAVHVPVAPTGPPGETTAVPSEYLLNQQGRPTFAGPVASRALCSRSGLGTELPLCGPPGERVVAGHTSASTPFAPSAAGEHCSCRLSLRLCPASKNICKFKVKSLGC